MDPISLYKKVKEAEQIKRDKDIISKAFNYQNLCNDMRVEQHINHETGEKTVKGGV